MFNRKNAQEPSCTVKEGARAGGKRRRALSFVAVIAMLSSALLFSTGAGSPVMNYLGGSHYFSRVLSKTIEAYSKELEIFAQSNAVIKKMSDIVSGAYTQSYITDEFQLDFNFDVDALRIAAELRSPEIPVSLNMYMDDSRFIVSAGDDLNVELSFETMIDDVFTFLENNELIEPDDDMYMLRDILSELEFSNEEIMAMASEGFDVDSVSKSFAVAFSSLIDKADFNMDKTEIEIGGELVSCDVITLIVDSMDIADWLRNDAVAEFKENEALRSLYDGMAALSEMADEELEYTYDEMFDEVYAFADELELAAEEGVYIQLDMYVYKDVVVLTRFGAESDTESYGIWIGALGGEYRLNDIFFVTEENGEITAEFSAVGNHIGSGPFTSHMESYEYGSWGEEAMFFDIEWDTELAFNNLTITVSDEDGYSESASMTVAVDKDSVIFAQTHEEPYFAYVVMPLEAGITMPPEKTVNIRDVNIFEILSALEQMGEVFE